MIMPISPPNPRRWLTLAIVASALFMICVDMTVLYTALPVLTHELRASAAEKLWIVNVYALVVAGLLPGLGTLGDRYGHRRLFMAGLAIFGAASLAAAFAPTSAWLIGSRGFLGIGGAAMMPATLAIIRHSFEDAHERSVAIGLWAGIAAGGLALGPVVGGLLLAHYSWGTVFLVNLPVVAAAALATLLLVPAQRPGGGAPWDLIGSVLVMTGLFALVFAIKQCAHQPLSVALVLTPLALAAALLGLFVSRQRRQATPLIDFGLFRLPGFGAAVAGAGLGTAGIVGLELVLGQHLQLVLDRSPLQAGLMILPAPLGSFLAGPLVGRLLRSRDAARVGASGLLLSATAALCLLPLSFEAGLTPTLTLLLLLVGAGVGAAATAASSAIMSGAPPGRSGMAASMEEVGFELGSALGVALFGSLMSIAYAAGLPRTPALEALPPVIRESLDDALRTADLLSGTAATSLRLAARQSFTSAFHAVVIGAAMLWSVTALWMLRQRRIS
jgi:DHA2 family multidrug resistance protein-like MFS transporter